MLGRPARQSEFIDRAALPSAELTRGRACRHPRVGVHVLNEQIFRSVLVRERKRADRSNQSFVVLLLAVENETGRFPSLWKGVVDGLAAVRRETDIVGWFERGATIGLIVTDCGAEGKAVARDLETRVRRELANRLDAEAFRQVSLDAHVHLAQSAAAGVSTVDPLLQDLRPESSELQLGRAFKRALDILGSGALLAVLSPLFLLIAILVRWGSRGPVFFRQTRVGEAAKPFTILKFRTMYSDSDSAIHKEYVTRFIKSGAGAKEQTNGMFKLAHDPRITPIGHLLRKTSLDELPQLWNVFRGEMSLVGPRPPLPYEVEQYQAWHCRRVLDAKPGITGLWQVTGRSRTTFDEMVRLDIRYTKTCSVWTDIKILLATPRAVISGKGAC